MRKFNLAVSALVLAVLAAWACINFNKNTNENVLNPTPVTSPSPSPTPSPSPSTGASDVESMGIFSYGITCAPPPSPDFGLYLLPTNCTALALTATPKTGSDKDGDGKNDDAKNHSNNIEWDVAGNSIILSADPGGNPFNKVAQVKTPRVAGVSVVSARLTEPNGKVFNATRSITVQ